MSADFARHGAEVEADCVVCVACGKRKLRGKRRFRPLVICSAKVRWPGVVQREQWSEKAISARLQVVAERELESLLPWRGGERSTSHAPVGRSKCLTGPYNWCDIAIVE
ncbi:unnamed protein product [Hermetia illucens]|uniref:Uncharacterized protein n=1 Tax=Hermetia illucens TaxID=343691 RepID=A0A7R8YM53_HERIL|nr:unnamed protein product [Hermetia illucens]